MTVAAGTVLLVHAHPDDELLSTGVRLCHDVAAGRDVHVLTCTLGDEGEVIPPGLAHLVAGREGALASHRLGELRAALAAAGATSHVLAEADGRARWRDSGMAGSAAADHPDAWVGSDADEAVDAVREVLARVAPDVVVTYDVGGGYQHPDHVRTHAVTRAAVIAENAELAADGRAPIRLEIALTPASWAREDRAWVREHAEQLEALGWRIPAEDEGYPVSVVDDALVPIRVVDPAAARSRAEALRHHRTQVIVTADGQAHALSNLVAARLPDREGYAEIDPVTGEHRSAG